MFVFYWLTRVVHHATDLSLIYQYNNCTNQTEMGLYMCCQCVRVQIVSVSSLWCQIFVLAGLFSTMVYGVTP